MALRKYLRSAQALGKECNPRPGHSLQVRLVAGRFDGPVADRDSVISLEHDAVHIDSPDPVETSSGDLGKVLFGLRVSGRIVADVRDLQ